MAILDAKRPAENQGRKFSPKKTIRYVYHESYDDPLKVQEILESLPLGQVNTTIGTSESFLQGTRSDLLGSEEEFTLFRHMNCLRHLAMKRLCSPGETTAQDHRCVQRLLDDANVLQCEIVLANQRLVYSIVNRFGRGRIPVEDLVAEANVALHAAVNAFDCHRGYRFSTYATCAIQRSLSRMLRKEARRSGQESAVDSIVMEEMIAADTVGHSHHEKIDRLVSILVASLSSAERVLVEQRYGVGSESKGHTFAELGEMYGVSGESMRQRLSRIHRKLRCVLEEEAELVDLVSESRFLQALFQPL